MASIHTRSARRGHRAIALILRCAAVNATLALPIAVVAAPPQTGSLPSTPAPPIDHIQATAAAAPVLQPASADLSGVPSEIAAALGLDLLFARSLQNKDVPIVISPSPSSVTCGNSFTCSITVQSLSGYADYVQVSCNQTGILISPSGSWPYNLSFPASGSTTQSFTIRTNSVATNTTIEIYACESDYDITNPADWQATGNVTVGPSNGPNG